MCLIDEGFLLLILCATKCIRKFKFYLFLIFIYNIIQDVFDIVPKGVRIREDHSFMLN